MPVNPSIGPSWTWSYYSPWETVQRGGYVPPNVYQQLMTYGQGQQGVSPQYYTSPYQTAYGLPQVLQQYQWGAGGVTPLTQALTQYGYSPDVTSQLLYPMARMEQQYALQQRGQEATLERAKALAKEYGLDPAGASALAERVASVKSLPIQQTLDSAIRTIENMYARGGASLGTGYERAIAEALGAAQQAAREQRVLAETTLIPNILSQLLRALG